MNPSKLFDKLDIELLMIKLEGYRFYHSAIPNILSSLKNRSQ